MGKGGIYPFKVFIKEPDLIPVFKSLEKYRTAELFDRRTSIRLGAKVAPIRKDVFIGSDSKFKRSGVGLGRCVELKLEPRGCGFTAIFNFKIG